jgi:hypothetical protein
VDKRQKEEQPECNPGDLSQKSVTMLKILEVSGK